MIIFEQTSEDETLVVTVTNDQVRTPCTNARCEVTFCLFSVAMRRRSVAEDCFRRQAIIIHPQPLDCGMSRSL